MAGATPGLFQCSLTPHISLKLPGAQGKGQKVEIMSSMSNKHHCSTATVKHISLNEVRKLTKKTEGLVLQGCAGEPVEWIGHINEHLTQSGILRDGFVFKPEDCAVFVNNGVICIYFDICGKPVDICQLATWRWMSRFVYHGMWLSDYVRNNLT